MKIYNWGIIGCGAIAPKFIQGLLTLPNAKLHAVASKQPERAKELADRFGVTKYYDNYDELVSDPVIDIVYIATTHNFHKENALLCIRHNKAVLCEKPFTVNLKEAREVINLAREKKVFLMEAMWTRFLPIIRKLKNLLEEQIIGEIRMVKADFGFKTIWGKERRILNRELAGGALLDVGIYPITMAYLVFQKDPLEIKSTSFIGETGIDEQSAYLFTYDKGEIAILSSAVTLKTVHEAIIIGTKGIIRIPAFWRSSKLIIQDENDIIREIELPFDATGYGYEAQEVMACLEDGNTESKIMSHEETLRIMKTMDIIRSQWNLKYPADVE